MLIDWEKTILLILFCPFSIYQISMIKWLIGMPNGKIAGEDAPGRLSKDLVAASGKKRGRDTFPVLIEIRFKQNPLPAAMELSSGHPVWYTISDLATHAYSEAKLRNILWQLGDSGASGLENVRASGEEHGTMVATNKGGDVSVAPEPVSSDAPVGPTTFPA